MNRCCKIPTLSVLKLDKDTKKGLAGAVFELVDDCGNISRQTTQVQGLVKFCLYKCGIYKLKEIKSPTGYAPSHAVYNICVDNCGNVLINGKRTDFISINNTKLHTDLTVRYLANGGTGNCTDTGLLPDSPYTIKSLEQTGITPPESLTFVSWNTKADGSGTDYSPEEVITLTENLTLYAQWAEMRTVMGLVYPTPFDDLGLGEDFLKGFEIVVELRETFLTPAPENLRTVVSILYPEVKIGRFVFQNVPFGDYVLYIKLAGRLVRCMNVSITESSPALTLLTPPGETLFDLWAGDVNNDLVVDSADETIINQLQGNHYLDPDYLFDADLNYDGVIDELDIDLAAENNGKTAQDYNGAEDVDFNS